MKKIVAELAQKETPFYLFDIDQVLKHIIRIREVFDCCGICYCIKANPFLVSYIDNYVDRFEVCSPGEFQICQYYEICPEKIFYTGVYKSKTEILEAIAYGVRLFSCESLTQLSIFSNLPNSIRKSIKLFLRYGTKFQFGLSEDDILEIANQDLTGLNIVGVHYFEKSQKREVKAIEYELNELDRICDVLRNIGKFSINEIEYGIGLDVDYFSPNPIEQVNALLYESQKHICKSRNYKMTIEMGRFISALCGYYVSKIVDIKKKNNINYAIIDGGSHQMHYDGQLMGMKLPHIELITSSKKNTSNWTICGSLCTHNDVIVRNLPIEGLTIGDTLIFKYIGAYSITEGMTLFLSRDIPSVFTYRRESGIQCVRKKTSTHYLNIGVTNNSSNRVRADGLYED